MQKKIFHNAAFLARMVLAIVLSMCLLFSHLPDVKAAPREDITSISFVNYDGTPFETGYPDKAAPGEKLYTAEEMEKLFSDFVPQTGCSWYLYAEGNNQYQGIPDPPSREGYEFRDWAAQGADTEYLYTVSEDTVFMARYARSGQYLVSFYYRFNDEEGSVAAPTSSVSCGLGAPLQITMPELESLKGITPTIKSLYEDENAEEAAEKLNEKIKDGVFQAELDQEFLELCRAAWFVEWDTETHNYQTDASGIVRINIPVTYTLNKKVNFQVEYHLQDVNNPNTYVQQEADSVLTSVTGSTRVNLEEMGLVNEYKGYSLTSVSKQNSISYTIHPDGSTVIDLYYDCNTYYISYELHGGNIQEPVAFRGGQAIPDAVVANPIRSGYAFTGWIVKTSDGTLLSDLPEVMPYHDLVLEAQWSPVQTEVTVTYWLENANDEDYVPVSSTKISVPTESQVGYEEIAQYLTPDGMATYGGITDGKYFELVDPEGIIPVTASGDGTSTINVYYDRKEYTLVFHVGWISDGSSGMPTKGYYCISTGGNSQANVSNTDWHSGYQWQDGARYAYLTMGNKTYSISNDTENCYQITAKYGAFIGSQWPVPSDTNTNTVKNNILFTWATHSSSPYYESHKDNKNIMGVYPAMTADLIINPEYPTVAHHLTAYWSSPNTDQSNGEGKGVYKVHHYFFENVPGAIDSSTSTVTFDDTYKNYKKISVADTENMEKIEGVSFYQRGELKVRTTNDAAGQNPPVFANTTFQYGCYNGEDVYFFYTYDDYTITYDENNPNLAQEGASQEKQTKADFHYVDGKLLKDMLTAEGVSYNYTPDQPYICQYGNQHIFGGWYQDPDCTIPIDWNSISPASSVTAYGKWESPTYDLTLEVPNGVFNQDVLNDFQAKGYAVTTQTEEDKTLYTIHDVLDGTPVNTIFTVQQMPVNNYGIDFSHWNQLDDDGESVRFLFDDSQVLSSDRTLTAQWVEEHNGAYVVRYLTEENPNNGLEPIRIENKIYYRLQPDEIVKNIVPGSTVVEEPKSISAYLPVSGFISQVVKPSNGGNETSYNFMYQPMTDQTLTYTVHYVLDTGEQYGRVENQQALDLIPPKTVTLEGASRAALKRAVQSTITGTVCEEAQVIPGYIPRDGWDEEMVLCAKADENHLYFYYKEGANLVSCSVEYFVWDTTSGEYQQKDSWTESLQKPLGAQLMAEQYAQKVLEETEQNLSVDWNMTPLSMTVTGTSSNNVLCIYLNEKAGGGSPPDWSKPSEELPEEDTEYEPEEKPPLSKPETPDNPGEDGDNGGGTETPVIPPTGGDDETEKPIPPQESGVDQVLNSVDHILYISGYPDGTCAPDQSITRAEVAMIFYHLLLHPEGESKDFPDVKKNAWYYQAVTRLTGMNIFSGYLDGTFQPDRPITRGEFAAVSVKFANLIEPDEEINFSDVDKDDWYYSWVKLAAYYGWVGGYPDGTFRPNEYISRVEVCSIVNRMLGRSADREGVQNGMGVRFPDVPMEYWGFYEIVEAATPHTYRWPEGALWEEWLSASRPS